MPECAQLYLPRRLVKGAYAQIKIEKLKYALQIMTDVSVVLWHLHVAVVHFILTLQ